MSIKTSLEIVPKVMSESETLISFPVSMLQKSSSQMRQGLKVE